MPPPAMPATPAARWPWRAWAAAALAALALALPAAAAAAATTAGPDCALHWQLTPLLDAAPRQLLVEMRFDTAGRTRSTLRLPAGWDGMTELPEAGAAPRLQALPGQPQLRALEHAPGERVQLRWRLTPPPGSVSAGSVQLGARWFALAGLGALPVPDELDERTAPTACVALTGLPDGARWASSHGAGEGDGTALLRVGAGPQPLRSRVQQALYAGGALALRTLQVDGQALTAALPATAPDEPAWGLDADALAAAGSQALAAQRRFWGDTAAGPLLLLALPGRGEAPAAAPWHQALALQADPPTAQPGPALDAALYRALARARVAERFGPLAHAGRGDEALRAWYSEGVADFLAHRALLRDGRWSAEAYAAALQRQLERLQDLAPRPLDNATLAARLGAEPAGALADLPAARGEWLALHWHAALRAAGQPGLEALLRGLQVGAAQARREGPISAPLATHRLLAALRRVLDDQAMADLTRFIDRGEPFEPGPTALGPCFQGRVQPAARWRLGFDAASLTRRVVSGVEPGGPAEAAGLRDGMVLAGHALVPGDASVPVRLQLREPDGQLRELVYLPAAEPLRQRLRFAAVPGALEQPACQGWLGLGAEAQRAAAAPGARTGASGKAARGAAAPPVKASKAGKAGKPGKTTKAGQAVKAGKSGAAAKPKAGKARPAR